MGCRPDHLNPDTVDQPARHEAIANDHQNETQPPGQVAKRGLRAGAEPDFAGAHTRARAEQCGHLPMALAATGTK
jgi:hypothetical protein